MEPGGLDTAGGSGNSLTSTGYAAVAMDGPLVSATAISGIAYRSGEIAVSPYATARSAALPLNPLCR